MAVMQMTDGSELTYVNNSDNPEADHLIRFVSSLPRPEHAFDPSSLQEASTLLPKFVKHLYLMLSILSLIDESMHRAPGLDGPAYEYGQWQYHYNYIKYWIKTNVANLPAEVRNTLFDLRWCLGNLESVITYQDHGYIISDPEGWVELIMRPQLSQSLAKLGIDLTTFPMYQSLALNDSAAGFV